MANNRDIVSSTTNNVRGVCVDQQRSPLFFGSNKQARLGLHDPSPLPVPQLGINIRRNRINSGRGHAIFDQLRLPKIDTGTEAEECLSRFGCNGLLGEGRDSITDDLDPCSPDIDYIKSPSSFDDPQSFATTTKMPESEDNPTFPANMPPASEYYHPQYGMKWDNRDIDWQWKDDLEAYRPRDWKQTQAAMLEAEKPFHIDDIPGMFDKDDPTTSTTQSTDHVMTDTSSIHMYDADEPFLNSSIQMKEEQVSLSPAKSALSSSPPLPLGHGQLHSPPSTSNMSHLTASDPNPADLPHIPELSFRDTAFDATPKPISDARATTESADMAQHAQNASPKADAVQKQDSSPLIASGEHDIQMEGETGPGLDVPGLDEMHGDEPPSNKTSALNISAGHEATAIPEATQPTQVKPEISIQSSAQLQASASSDKATKSPSEHDHEGDFEDELSLVIPAQGQRHPEEPTDLAAPTFIPSKTTLAPQIPGLSYRPDEPVTPSTKITSAVQGEAKAGKLLNDATVAATFLDTEVSEGGSTNEAIVPPTAQDHPRTPFSSIFPGYIAEKAPEVISRSLQAATMDPFAAPQMPAKGVRNTSETGDPHQNLISVGPFPKPKAHTPPPQPNSSPSKGPTSPASKISSANQSSSSEDPLSLPGPTPTPIRSPAPSSNNSNTLRHVGSTPQASVVIPSAKAGRNPRNRADPANSPAVTRRRSQNAAKVEQDEKGKGKGKRGRKSSTASASHQGPAKKVRRSARVSSEGATTEESGKQ